MGVMDSSLGGGDQGVELTTDLNVVPELEAAWSCTSTYPHAITEWWLSKNRSAIWECLNIIPVI